MFEAYAFPSALTTVYTHFSWNLFNPALAPLAPQFWGELNLVFGFPSLWKLTQVFGFLPPNLGGRGGQCKVFETCLYTVAQEL
jgi:hypothetical protein